VLVLTHDPNDKLPYWWDFATSFLTDGDTIESQTVTCDDDTVTVTAVGEEAGIVSAWVEGGRLGTTAQLKCSIVTVAGRKKDRTTSLLIRED
jgi:hypothetical protein